MIPSKAVRSNYRNLISKQHFITVLKCNSWLKHHYPIYYHYVRLKEKFLRIKDYRKLAPKKVVLSRWSDERDVGPVIRDIIFEIFCEWADNFGRFGIQELDDAYDWWRFERGKIVHFIDLLNLLALDGISSKITKSEYEYYRKDPEFHEFLKAYPDDMELQNLVFTVNINEASKLEDKDIEHLQNIMKHFKELF